MDEKKNERFISSSIETSKHKAISMSHFLDIIAKLRLWPYLLLSTRSHNHPVNYINTIFGEFEFQTSPAIYRYIPYCGFMRSAR